MSDSHHSAIMILTRRNWINISFPELFEDRALAMQDQVRGYRFQQHRRSNAQQHHGVRLGGKAHNNPLRPGDVMNAEPTQSLPQNESVSGLCEQCQCLVAWHQDPCRHIGDETTLPIYPTEHLILNDQTKWKTLSSSCHNLTILLLFLS